MKEESQILLTEAIEFAEKMINEHGEFYPFGWVIKINGEMESVNYYGGKEYPKGTEFYQDLKEILILGANKGKYRAVAIVSNIITSLPNSNGKSDAISVEIEHCDGYSINYIEPYELTDNKLFLDTPFVIDGKGDIFS